jgi:vesicle coat complex subunit
MLQDLDANVITNVIRAIDELQITNGGIEVNQSTVMNLLNRIGEFSEWGLNTILELVARYKPASEDEIFAIMNLLDPVLRTANSGAVLATFKCFMKLTANLKHLHPQIYLRSKPPLLTLITGSHSELQFVMLKHLELILIEPEAKGIFDDEYRQFFVRYNEPPHVKHLKVDLLPLITNDRNAKDIATELGEYVTDVDAELSKRAIRAIGEIAIKIQLVSVEMTQILMELIYMEVSYIRAEAAKIVSNVIRAAPNISGLVLPHLSRLLKKCDDEDAKASLIWMLGEFGEAIVEAPYMLEPIIDNIYADEQSSVVIKLQILTTALKLFFKRPPEMQAMLGRLLRLAINDSSNQDLHDRALLYYRLLTVDLQAAKGLFSGNKACAIVDGNFAEAIDKLKNDKLFNEFNSLAIVYGVPSVQFICEENQLVMK